MVGQASYSVRLRCNTKGLDYYTPENRESQQQFSLKFLRGVVRHLHLSRQTPNVPREALWALGPNVRDPAGRAVQV